MKKKQLLEVLATTQAALDALRTSQAAAEAQEAGPPLAEWLDIHEAQVRSRPEYSEQTIRNRCVLIGHCRRLWGTKPLKGLKPHEITSAVRETFIEAGKTSTAQRVIREMKDVYAEAIANDWCENNPALVVKKPKHQVMRNRLSLEVYLRMLKRAEVHSVRWVRCMLLLALVTSQRRADVGKARFKDIYDGHLHVEQQKRAGKPHGARLAIPLALRLDVIDMTLGEIVDICRASGAMLKDEGETTLVRQRGGKPLERSSLTARFHELIVAELGPDAYEPYHWPSLHECRSLAARTFTRVNKQTLLGHRHPEMTAVYEDDRGLNAAVYKRVELLDDTPA